MSTRYADLRPLDPLPEKPPTCQRTLDEARVRAAFDEFNRSSRVLDRASSFWAVALGANQ